MSQPQTTYRVRFQSAEVARQYDDAVYASGSHDSHLHALERPILTRIARQLAATRPVRYLDFACGTGRILSIVAPHAATAVGIDVSDEMVARARQRVTAATVRVHDLSADGPLAEAPFDLITAFRFFLNVEPASRDGYLTRLAANLASRASLLVFNVHGNRHSVRHLARYRHHASAVPMNEMSGREVEAAIGRAGLEVVERWGIGVLPRSLYRGGIAPVAGAFDRLMHASGVFDGVSQNLIYACRRRFS